MTTPAAKARVVRNPGILGGTPVLEGTRVPADAILAELLNGRSGDEIRMHYPTIPPGALEACAEWDAAGRPDNAPDPGFVHWWSIIPRPN